MNRLLLGVVALVVAGSVSMAAHAQTYLGPTPYLRASDSPFTVPFDWFRLETFESGALSQPGVSISSGAVVIGPGPLTDSVDADDGVVDGSGRGGHSLYSGGILSSITFTFDRAVLGNLPTHAGLVWTDIGNATPTFGRGRIGILATPQPIVRDIEGGFGSPFAAPALSFLVRDPATGALIDLRTGLPFLGDLASLGEAWGDGSAAGETAEDLFLGIVDPRGILGFTIFSFESTDWEIDHLQFGFSAAVAATVAEPGSALMLLAIGTALRARQRTRRRR